MQSQLDRDIPSYLDWREPKPTFDFMLAQCFVGGERPVVRRVSVSRARPEGNVVDLADPDTFKNTVAQSFGVSTSRIPNAPGIV